MRQKPDTANNCGRLSHFPPVSVPPSKLARSAGAGESEPAVAAPRGPGARSVSAPPALAPSPDRQSRPPPAATPPPPPRVPSATRVSGRGPSFGPTAPSSGRARTFGAGPGRPARRRALPISAAAFSVSPPTRSPQGRCASRGRAGDTLCLFPRRSPPPTAWRDVWGWAQGSSSGLRPSPTAASVRVSPASRVGVGVPNGASTSRRSRPSAGSSGPRSRRSSNRTSDSLASSPSRGSRRPRSARSANGRLLSNASRASPRFQGPRSRRSTNRESRSSTSRGSGVFRACTWLTSGKSASRSATSRGRGRFRGPPSRACANTRSSSRASASESGPPCRPSLSRLVDRSGGPCVHVWSPVRPRGSLGLPLRHRLWTRVCPVPLSSSLSSSSPAPALVLPGAYPRRGGGGRGRHPPGDGHAGTSGSRRLGQGRRGRVYN